VDAAKLATQTAITAGYPRNQGGNAMWMFSGKLGLLTEHGATMLYEGDLTEGQSGSPVWIDQGGQINLIGIAVARGSGNRILRMSPYVDSQLNEWMLRAESASLELEYERLECESGGLQEAQR
jgi:V8-like Glu-specific endopeptidase